MSCCCCLELLCDCELGDIVQDLESSVIKYLDFSVCYGGHVCYLHILSNCEGKCRYYCEAVRCHCFLQLVCAGNQALELSEIAVKLERVIIAFNSAELEFLVNEFAVLEGSRLAVYSNSDCCSFN